MIDPEEATRGPLEVWLSTEAHLSRMHEENRSPSLTVREQCAFQAWRHARQDRMRAQRALGEFTIYRSWMD